MMRGAHWLLPLFVSAGMAIGALLGLALVSDAALRDGPAGDLAGALGALVVVTCVLVGVGVSAVTMIARALAGRPAPHRLWLRFALSVGGGIVIGAAGSASLLRDTLLPWIPLLAVPMLTTWSYSRESSR